MSTKRCTYCKEMLPYSDFSKDKYKEDGLKHICRTCSSKVAKEWTKKNPKY